MADKFELKALITAVDKLSPTLKAQMKVLNSWKRQFESAGKGGLAMGAGLAAGMAVQVKAFADVENAQVGLMNTLMNKNGVAGGFEQISKMAVELGNQLPGTTADFMNMASQLKGLGVDANTIAGGALKATAYLAVVGERFHVTYEDAAETVGKVGNALGVAAKDLVPFADLIQRTLHLGVKLPELQYAMAKVAPVMKTLRQQGIGAATDLVPLSAMLIQMGFAGETAGTGIEKVINGAIKAGKFKDIPTLVKDLEKFGQSPAPERLAKFMKLFGEEGARVAMVISAGGYGNMIKRMEQQASLQQRINNSLGTLTNLWEAATGTFTNAMAAFGEVYSPDLKALAASINDVSAGLMDWAKANGPTIKTALALAGGVVVMKLSMLALAGAAGGLSVAMKILNGTMKLNPFMLLLQGLLIAVPLIIENWDWVVENVGGAIDKLVKVIGSAWNGAVATLKQGWDNFVAFLKPGIDTVKFLFDSVGDAVLKFVDIYIDGFKKLINNPITKLIGQGVIFLGKSVGSILPDFNDNDGSGMRPPGYQKPANVVSLDQRRQMLQAGAGRTTVNGAIDVNFNNAPAGMRVAPSSKGPVAVNPNVGYRTIGTGLP